MDKLRRLKEFVCDFANIQPELITEETNIYEDLAIDSISMLNLAVAIENEFGIVITQSDIENIVTIGDFVKLIND